MTDVPLAVNRNCRWRLTVNGTSVNYPIAHLPPYLLDI